jgi:hypothetical protein
MKKTIPKFPETPVFTDEQIRQITEICFLNEQEPTVCDASFSFGGSHPGNIHTPVDN